MERGPYGQGPEDPRRPVGDPRYQQRPVDYGPPPEYERERRIGLAEVVALLAGIAAIVAIVLAIDARKAGSDDEEVARQVRQQTQREINRIESAVEKKTGSAGSKARRAQAEAEGAEEEASELASEVASLEGEIRALKTQQNEVRNSLQNQSEAISDVRATLREEG